MFRPAIARCSRHTGLRSFTAPSVRSWRCTELKKSVRRTSHVAQTREKRDDPFKILFLGRDEFSCLVLRELYAARGALSCRMQLRERVT